MKINELMIDDHICLDGDIDYVGPIRVQQIGYQGNDDIIADGDVYSMDDIVPIPLTPDILEKNGFNKQEDVNEWSYYKSQDDKGQYMILWSMDYDYLEIGSYTNAFGEFNRFGVRYVHELQHALRLCGIEKEITI